MLIDKEYPATHSMDTAWYFVDEDDNVAIFEIQENGPIPHEIGGSQNCTQELCFDYFIQNNGELCFSDEQVIKMTEGLWKESVSPDHYWSYEDVFMIDINKKKEFFDYLSKARSKCREKRKDFFIPVCLSEKYGIYFVDLNAYKYGKGMDNPHAKYLFEKKIVLKHCHIYFSTDYDDETIDSNAEDRCPFYLYVNDWCAAPPHKRVSIPAVPMTLSQMPESVRNKVIRLNLKFKDAEEIQIAQHLLCYCSGWHKLYTPEGAVYTLVHLPGKGSQFVLDASMSTEKSKELGIDVEDIYEYVQRFPRVLDESRVPELLLLPENKDFVDLRSNG